MWTISQSPRNEGAMPVYKEGGQSLRGQSLAPSSPTSPHWEPEVHQLELRLELCWWTPKKVAINERLRRTWHCALCLTVVSSSNAPNTTRHKSHHPFWQMRTWWLSQAHVLAQSHRVTATVGGWAGNWDLGLSDFKAPSLPTLPSPGGFYSAGPRNKPRCLCLVSLRRKKEVWRLIILNFVICQSSSGIDEGSIWFCFLDFFLKNSCDAMHWKPTCYQPPESNGYIFGI